MPYNYARGRFLKIDRKSDKVRKKEAVPHVCRCPEDALGLGRLEPEVVRSVADFVQMLEGEFADAAFGDVGE